MMTTNHSSRLLAYLQLLRIPNVFTAVADVTMGFLFVGQSVQQFPLSFIAIVAASSCLYLAGMVLNDVFDFEVDLAERPQRPLPSGRISRKTATVLGLSLMATGLTFGWLAGFIHGGPYPLRSGILATLLAVMIVLYDGVVKKTSLAPLAMGACRLFNVLFGMSVAVNLDSLLGYTPAQWLIAGGFGVYIVGVTLFAREEAVTSRRSNLVVAACVMLTGIMMLGFFPWASLAPPTRFTTAGAWPFLLFILMASVIRRCGFAIHNPTPGNVQVTIKQAILSLIVLNAAIILAVAATVPAVLVFSLLIPTLLLGRWVYST